MRHASLSFNEVLGPDGKRGYITVKGTGDGHGKVVYKPYGVPTTYEASLSDVAGFLIRQESHDNHDR